MHRHVQRTSELIQSGDVVLFHGDSITYAFRKPDEANNAYQLGAGYVLMTASNLLRVCPAHGLRFINCGKSGKTVRDLCARWQEDVLALKPTIISLLVGINDVGQEVDGNAAISPEQFERDYRSLLLRSHDALPGVRFILCEPFALPCGKVDERWKSPLARRQRIVAALALEFNAAFVPLQRVFAAAARKASATYWMYDGIHPTAQGHLLIAEAWLRVARRPMLHCGLDKKPVAWKRTRFSKPSLPVTLAVSTRT